VGTVSNATSEARMNFCISGDELRKALKDIEAAEANGFHYCLAVFDIVSGGRMIDDCRAEYSDLIEKAHPTDGNLTWGRFQGVSRNNRFVKGKLIPIKKEKEA
jgi:hypothetical protein